MSLESKPMKRTPYGKWGVIATLTWLFAIILIVVIKGTNPFAQDYNNIGDFLAGVVGPVAFLWLVLGFYQQRDELIINTEALQLQAKDLSLQTEELRNSVAQQKIIAESHQNMITQEARKHHVAMQPILICTYQHTAPRDGELWMSISIDNVGHPITDFVAWIVIENEPYILDSTAYAPFKYVIKFMIPLDDLVNEHDVHIEYKDGALEKQEETYQVHIDHLAKDLQRQYRFKKMINFSDDFI